MENGKEMKMMKKKIKCRVWSISVSWFRSSVRLILCHKHKLSIEQWQIEGQLPEILLFLEFSFSLILNFFIPLFIVFRPFFKPNVLALFFVFVSQKILRFYLLFFSWFIVKLTDGLKLDKILKSASMTMATTITK